MTTAFEADYLQERDCKNLNHIPGLDGMPILGRTFEMVKDIGAVVNEHINQFGHLSRIGFAFQKGVLITHPDDFREIYLDKNRDYSNTMGYAKSIGEFYNGALLTQDFDRHIFQRRIMQNAFKSDALKGYVEIMNPIIAQGISDWHSLTNFLFVPEVKKVLLFIVGKVFVGLDRIEGAEFQRFNQAFLDIIEKGLMAIFKKRIPGLAYYKGIKGKEYMEEYFRQLIPLRRQGNGSDLMSFLVKETDEDGNYWPDDLLVPQLNLLFFASHDTTTSTISHLMLYLSKPENISLQNKLRQQAMAYGSDFINYEYLDQFVDLEHALLEATRLHPSVTITPRRTVRECSLRGYRIPAHTILYLIPYWAHRSDEYWRDGDKFDPDRFSEGRAEHKNHPFCFVPFGGGAHKCLGMHFAIMNAKLLMHQLLRHYEFSLPSGYNQPFITLPMPKPGGDLPLVVTPL